MSILPNDSRCLEELSDITDPLYVLILISWQLLCYLILLIIFIGTNGEHLYHFIFTRDEPCSYFKLVQDCNYVYHSYVLVLSGSAMIQVAIGIERVVSCVYNKQYETFTTMLSLTMVIVTLCLALFLQIIVLDEINLLEFRLGCVGLPLSGGVRTTSLYISILICNAFSLLLFMVAWINGKKTARQNGQYALSANYHKIEHYRLLRMFLPNVLIQALFYAFYCLTTMIARYIYKPQSNGVGMTIFMRHNALPYCVVLELILMHYRLKQVDDGRKKFKTKITTVETQNCGEQYFQNLSAQWNTKP